MSSILCSVYRQEYIRWCNGIGFNPNVCIFCPAGSSTILTELYDSHEVSTVWGDASSTGFAAWDQEASDERVTLPPTQKVGIMVRTELFACKNLILQC